MAKKINEKYSNYHYEFFFLFLILFKGECFFLFVVRNYHHHKFLITCAYIFYLKGYLFLKYIQFLLL